MQLPHHELTIGTKASKNMMQYMSIILRRAPSMAHGGLVAGKKTSSKAGTICDIET
jgi:hypothetical protein